MQDKIALITDGTGGIGLETARGIDDTGATIVIVGRNEARGRNAVEDIKSSTGNSNIEFMAADLSSQTAVLLLVDEFEERYGRLDVLVNNVGGLYGSRRETGDGIEAMFAINHVNPYLLIRRLLPLLQNSAPARIVNVTTGAHRFVKLDLDNLQAEREFDTPIAVYARSKLVNLMASYYLARALDGTGVTVNIADPGVASTDMNANMTADFFPQAMRLLFPLWKVIGNFTSVEKAAQSSIYLATSPDVEGITGKYFNPAQKRVKSSRESYNETYQRWIVEITDNLVIQAALKLQSEKFSDKHSLPIH
ncbi:MAG: SDR family NAD(P)-dependent oxidoreductase [Chloroflexi bacterium]|nr:SDR family NAD(P)-dependent oxidoreductase [Chloroflexota bacterium]